MGAVQTTDLLQGKNTLSKRVHHPLTLRVALVDDVLTTGTTAAEAARELRRAGASEVEIWCLARTPEPG